MTTIRSTLFAATALATLTACGPSLISVGTAELADDDNDNQVVVLVFVNDGNELVALDLDGTGAGGQALVAEALQLAPGSRTTLSLDDPQALRVRARELLQDASRPAATWDFALDAPADGTECALDVASAVVAGITQTATEPDAIEVQTLGGTGSQPEFRRLDRADLAFEPDLVRIHPSGGYVYTLETGSDDSVEIRAWRIESEDGAIEFIDAEFGSTPRNPTTTVATGELEFAIEPRGRFAYLLDSDAATRTTTLTMFPIEADGTLGLAAVSTRDLVLDLAFRAGGEFAYTIESTGPSSAEVRSQRVRDDGTFEIVGIEMLACTGSATGRLEVHPEGNLVFGALQEPGGSNVRIGSYFVDPFGGLVLVDTRCADLETVDDLEFDPAGSFLYLTGTVQDPIGSGPIVRRAVRYSIDTATGLLGSAVTDQDLGLAETMTRTSDPGRSRIDPLRDLVYVAIDDRLVPHVRSAGGALEPLPTGISLPYGGPSSTNLVEGVARGCCRITRP